MRVLEAKLVHDPTGFNPVRSSVLVEDQRLSHPSDIASPRVVHCSVFSGSFPVSRSRGSVGSVARGIFPVSEAEEVPLTGVELCHLF